MIKVFTKEDIDPIVIDFEKGGWPKPQSTFELYWQEQQTGRRLVWIAFKENQIVGYVTLKKISGYLSFQEKNIPEINDLNVLPFFRKSGIGSMLLQTAEHAASKMNDVVGLGVGLYEGYGNAHRLYIARGYIPDGEGITYKDKRLKYGDNVLLDDDLVLWFTKKLI